MSYVKSPLGKTIESPKIVDPDILYFIDRKESAVRKKPEFLSLKMSGEDIWNCYEFSWLNKNGIPNMGICRIRYDSNSRSIVESKSLKLYLSGFYNTEFHNTSEIEEIIYRHLDPKLYAGKLSVSIINLEEEDRYAIVSSISQSFNLETHGVMKNKLSVDLEKQTEEYFSCNIFRSLCPVTSQPDWATVEIHYRGPEIDRASLLGYLVSYRERASFHEEVCETIFYDLSKLAKLDFLFVRCSFLRRGGIDLNPVRYSSKYNYNPTPTRLLRQ